MKKLFLIQQFDAIDSIRKAGFDILAVYDQIEP